MRDGQAVQVPVTLVRRRDDSALVEGALTPGEAVVVEGVQRLRPGRAVTAVGGMGAAKPAAPAAGPSRPAP